MKIAAPRILGSAGGGRELPDLLVHQLGPVGEQPLKGEKPIKLCCPMA